MSEYQPKKTIMITGATSGIGLTVARDLYEKGYALLLIGRDETKLMSVSTELGGQLYYKCDLANIGEIRGIFDYCKDNDIKLDGLVHSAGCVTYTPIRTLNMEHDDIQMQVHFNAFVQMCKFFGGKRISNDSASVVAISSMASLTKSNGTLLYSASKAALNVAVSVASKEFLKRKIRVNAILPANVDTRMSKGVEDWINIEEVQPFGLIPPKEIANLAAFLLSDESRFITGALIPISGGMEA